MSLQEKSDRAANYVRIRRAEKKDPERIHSGLQKGLRIEHPEKIAGYAGFFYDSGDVYASGYIADQMDYDRFRHFVTDSLKRFDSGDYGNISRNDDAENIENRWLFGIDRLFGRYGYCFEDGEKAPDEKYDEIICIRKHDGNTWVTCDSEADWFLFLDEKQLKGIRDRCQTENESDTL